MSLIGIKPEQVPSNADLGSAAYRDADELVAEAVAAVPAPDLSGLVTLATPQTVSGNKTFTGLVTLTEERGPASTARRTLSFSGTGSPAYLVDGEYQELFTWNPTADATNCFAELNIYVQSGHTYYNTKVKLALRANTLPDLGFTGQYTADGTAVELFTPVILMKETAPASFVVAVKIHSTLYGTLVADCSLQFRSSSELSNLVWNTVDGSEYTVVPAGYTEVAIDRLDPVFTGGNQTISGTKTFSSAPVLPGVNGGPLAGRRNFLHNGDMQVATTPTFRNVLSTTPVIDRFVADRWALSVGGAATMQMNIIASGGPISTLQRSLRVVTTVADSTVDAVDYVIVKQSLEAADIFPLIGLTFTLSFWSRTSTVGTYSVAFRNGAGTSSYVAQFQMNAPNVWEYKTVTVVGGLPASGHDWTGAPGMSVSFVLGAGSNYRTATTGTWLLSNVLAGTTAQSLQAGLARYMEISGVQLELGAVATPFEPTISAVESSICRRYREAGNIYAGGYGIGGTAQRFGYVEFKTPKALATPDLILSNVSYGNSSGIVTELLNRVGFGYYGTITGSGAYAVTGDWLVNADWG